MKKMKNEIKEIMNDLDTNCLTISCCGYSTNGTLVTHCYYDEDNDDFIFTSGDMEEDKHAEEIILTDEQKTEVFQAIIECYS
jgi:hypothetical protein